MSNAQRLSLPFTGICALACFAAHADNVVVNPALIPGNCTFFTDGISANAFMQRITTGPDGNLWFTEGSGNRVGRITPQGVVTEFSEGITGDARPFGIVAGPDGNIWFTEVYGNRVGRITPQGVITEFSDGISPGVFNNNDNSNYINTITAGPDGNLWFTETSGNRIGRVTTAGVVTEFSDGITANAGPYGIVAGTDGNLWFTEDFVAGIANITPQGTVTEFRAGLATNNEPQDIASDANGDLWFTYENAVGGIGRITQTGDVTLYNGGPSILPALGIIVDHGNIWFTGQVGDNAVSPEISLLDRSGSIDVYQCPSSASGLPLYLTKGPDGNLWFTEYNGPVIGRFNIEIFADRFGD